MYKYGDDVCCVIMITIKKMRIQVSYVQQLDLTASQTCPQYTHEAADPLAHPTFVCLPLCLHGPPLLHGHAAVARFVCPFVYFARVQHRHRTLIEVHCAIVHDRVVMLSSPFTVKGVLL